MVQVPQMPVLRILGALTILLLCVGACSSAGEVIQGKVVLTWGEPGDKPGEFHSPIGLAMNSRDELFVTDLNNARVQKFSENGTYLGQFDLPRDVPNRKTNIVGGIALDPEGQIYLSFMVQHKLVVYTETGKLVREWGKRGKAEGEFQQPGGIVVAPTGEVYVADQGNHRIQVFTKEGMYLGQWGEHGSQLGQFGGDGPAGSRFGGPHFLSRDSQGRFYTTEGTLGRVQQFSAEGKPLLAWGNKGDQPGGFGSLQTGFSKTSFGPVGVYVDRHDRVWSAV